MCFTEEEKLKYIMKFAPLLRKLVRIACDQYNLNKQQQYEDLFQDACEGILFHLGKSQTISELYCLALLQYRVKGYIREAVRKMHVVSISKHQFVAKKNEYQQLSLVAIENEASESDEDRWLLKLLLDEYLEDCTSGEREAILKKAEGMKQNELLELIGVSNDMAASRFFSKVQKELRDLMNS